MLTVDCQSGLLLTGLQSTNALNRTMTNVNQTEFHQTQLIIFHTPNSLGQAQILFIVQFRVVVFGQDFQNVLKVFLKYSLLNKNSNRLKKDKINNKMKQGMIIWFSFAQLALISIVNVNRTGLVQSKNQSNSRNGKGKVFKVLKLIL